MVLKDLQELGLSEKEAAVYLAALELGTDTVQNIAKRSKVKRVTTYVVLKSLMKKGLVSTIDHAKKTLFVAEEPSRIARYLDQQINAWIAKKNSVQELIAELSIINNKRTDKPKVRFFEGQEGVDTLINEFYKEFLKEKKRKASEREKIYIAYSFDLLHSFFSEKDITKNRNIRVEAGVESIAIYNADTDRTAAPLSQRHRVSSDEYPIPCDIAVFKDKIRLISLGAEPSAILIIDEKLAEGLRSLFKLAVKAARI